MVGTVDLGNVRFSASFNTSGLDAGTRAMRDTQNQANKTSDALKRVKAPATPDTSWIRGTQNLLRSLAAQSTLTLGPLSGVSTRIQALNALMSVSGLAGGVMVGALAGVSVGLFGLGAAAVKSTMQIQKADLALKAVTGSAIEAKVQLDFVRQVSDQAGIGFTTAAKSWARFEASAKSTGLTLAQTKKSFIETSLAAGTLQLGADDTAGVFRALEQILSKGTVQSEELRGQLADRFPAAFSIAAQAVGKTTKELGEMMKKGDVISKDFVPAFTAAMVKFYNIDPSKPINSLQASLNRAANAWTFFAQGVDKAFAISAAFQKVVDLTTRTLNNMTGQLENIKAVLGGVVGAFAGFAAASAAVGVVAGLLARGVIAAGAFAAAAGGLKLAILGLNAAMMATPLGWVGIIIRIGAAVAGYVAGAKMAEKVTRDLNASMVDTSGIDSFISAQTKLRTATAEATQEMIKQQLVGLKIARDNLRDSQEAHRNAQAAATPAGAQRNAIFGNMPMGMMGIEAGAATQQRAQMTMTIAGQRALSESTTKLVEDTTKLNKETDRVTALMNIAKMPITEVTSGLNDMSKSAEDAGKKGRDSTNSLLDTIRDAGIAAEKSRKQLDALKKGTDFESANFLAIESLYRAMDALSNVEPKNLPKVEEALTKLGFTSGTTAEKLGALFLQMDKGSSDVDKAKQKTTEAKDALGGLMKAYTDAFKAKEMFEGRAEALKSGGTAGADAFDRARTMADEVRAYENLVRKQALMTQGGMDESKILANVEAYRQLLASNEALSLSYDRQAEAVFNAEQAVMSWYNTSMDSLLDVIFESKNFGSAIMDIGKSLARMAVQIMVLEPLGNMMRGWVQGTNAVGQPNGKQGIGGMLAKIGLKMFGFANGGMPPVGQASIVGENGPELFVPSHTGRIVPNSQLQGPQQSSIIDARTYIDARGATMDTIAELKQELAARDARLRGELPHIIDGRNRDSRLRGRA